jgi:outer membrane lipoprotein SlyB
LPVGQKVLVIAGSQARVVPDYTVPFEPPSKTAAKPAVPPQSTADAHPSGDGSTPHAAATPVTPAPGLPAETAVPPQLPAAFGSTAVTPPPIITPPEVSENSTSAASTTPKPKLPPTP